MTYCEDLSECTYYGRSGGILLAVGWLDEGRPYARGPVDPDVFAALVRLLRDPWQPVAIAGHHPCPLCRFSGGPAQLHYGEDSVTLGSANLFVPSDDRVYVAPSLVVHYIDAHGYAPPQDFLHAVRHCPPMRSMEYLRALAKHGVLKLTKDAKTEPRP